MQLINPSTSPNELNTTLTPHSIIHGDACFAYFNKIWGIPLLMATSAAHARPELSKTESWKLTLGTWCVGEHPSDNEAYVGIARDQCGKNEATLIIGENGYTWVREEGLICRYSSGKARFDNTIPASTKTVGVWVFHIVAGRIRKPAEGAIRKYTHSFDMYVSKGTLWIEKLRSDEKP